MIEVQRFYKDNYVQGQTIEWFFANMVKDKFNISRRYFIEILQTPAERLLKELNEKRESNSAAKQIAMAFGEGDIGTVTGGIPG